jgi:hypothetical protein
MRAERSNSRSSRSNRKASFKNLLDLWVNNNKVSKILSKNLFIPIWFIKIMNNISYLFIFDQ